MYKRSIYLNITNEIIYGYLKQYKFIKRSCTTQLYKMTLQKIVIYNNRLER